MNGFMSLYQKVVEVASRTLFSGYLPMLENIINLAKLLFYMDMFSQIQGEVAQHFVEAKGSHNWDHTERVYNLCMYIGKIEDADVEVLKYAAVLHDIGRDYQDKSNGKWCHAEKGAKLAEKMLEKYKVNNEKIEKVIHASRFGRAGSSMSRRSIRQYVSSGLLGAVPL